MSVYEMFFSFSGFGFAMGYDDSDNYQNDKEC